MYFNEWINESYESETAIHEWLWGGRSRPSSSVIWGLSQWFCDESLLINGLRVFFLNFNFSFWRNVTFLGLNDLHMYLCVFVRCHMLAVKHMLSHFRTFCDQSRKFLSEPWLLSQVMLSFALTQLTNIMECPPPPQYHRSQKCRLITSLNRNMEHTGLSVKNPLDNGL